MAKSKVEPKNKIDRLFEDRDDTHTYRSKNKMLDCESNLKDGKT